jgi:hypothetical protein
VTRQDPHIAPASETAAIAEMVAARLQVLERGGSVVGEALTDLPPGARLTKLCTLFGLDAFDQALLLTALAPQIDPRLAAGYEAVCGRRWATEWLAARLFGIEDRALLHGGSAVELWRLVRTRRELPGEPPAVEADPAVRNWIFGQLSIEPDLLGALTLVAPRPALAGWPVEATARLAAAASAREVRAVVTVEGLPGAGRATFAACVAQAVGQRALAADPQALGREWGPDETLRAHRYALVAGAALIWRGRPPAGALWPAGLWPPALQAVTLDPGDAALDPGALAPIPVGLPAMGAGERQAMLLAEVPGARDWPAATLEALARRRALTPAAIARIGRMAPEGDAAALSAANEAGAATMGELAGRMTGGLDWDDLVLPGPLKTALQDLSFEAGVRADTWDAPAVRRLFGGESGMIALFHGAPGTGKTMAAQVIARALGQDLYRIDCAAIVSKYIGETAKNLRAIFARARGIDAVLLFDEAEALFSRRTEVRDSHDRHANTDTSYLLQLIEGDFEGTAILANNRMGDMDRAFLRRIRYALEFPRPGAGERTEIWRRAAGALMPARAEALAALWPLLGETLDVTGAQIKTILLSAHFAGARLGQAVGPEHLLDGAAREFAKEGRSLNKRDIARIRCHA